MLEISQIEGCTGTAYNNSQLIFSPVRSLVYQFTNVGNGTPERVHHNRDLTICDLPLDLSKKGAETITKALKERDEFFTRIAENHSEEWDGSNHRGKLPDALQEEWNTFCEEFQELCSEAPSVWSADEYLQSTRSQVAEEIKHLSEEDLEIYAESLVEEGESNDAELDLDDVLQELQNIKESFTICS